MMASKHDDIRRVLLDNTLAPDGLTCGAIAKILKREQSSVLRALRTMPDVYIDRWDKRHAPGRGRYAAIYCAVPVPENCPHPEGSR